MIVRRQSNYKWGLLVLCLLLSRIALCDPAFASDRRLEILDQQVGCVITEQELIEEIESQQSSTDSVFLTYPRFDVFIDSAFWDHDSIQLAEFFDLFEPRLNLLESITGWTLEESFGHKLQISVTVAVSAGCSGGYITILTEGIRPIVNLKFADPLYKTGCQLPYYENGDSSFGNPGVLGDFWGYMYTAIHEASHVINPKEIYKRSWLREGWGVYNGYNILVASGDINQETADYYIYNAKLYTGAGNTFLWESYTSNDYRDGSNREIQESTGYEITAWMFTLLKDNHSLDWSAFYSILNKNLETLKSSDVLGAYSVDAFVIDVFGKALGHTDFETQTKPIFRYDGPSGPGWGVRNIPIIDWYADLTADVSPTLIQC